MTEQWPKVRARRTTELSPWIRMIERDVEFSAGDDLQTYYALGQADYVSIVAVTPAGQIPIVRQYRPALETFTWELPAGLVDPGEDPQHACCRELLEETGFATRAVRLLSTASPDTGRLSNKIHSFYVEADDRLANFTPEAGMTVDLVSTAQLSDLIRRGEFVSHLHLGALMFAHVLGLLRLN
jgi:8-oxo-dGTP pyrophosphatase MutT (NUDIX family)